MRSGIQVIGCAFLCLLLGSCSPSRYDTITTQDFPWLADNTQQRIPLRAGFFADKDLERIIYTGEVSLYYTNGDWTRIHFDVHEAFLQATQRMFGEVVPISAQETLGDFKAKNLDVIVSVRPVVCECYMERPPGLPFGWQWLVNARITADWAVTSPDGRPVTWTKAVGEGRAQIGGKGQGCTQAFVEALDAQFRRAYGDIVKTNWWNDPSRKPR